MSSPVAVLADTGPTTLTKTWYVDGDATDVGTVTVGIVDADGTEVVAAGTAVTSDGGDGTYTYTLGVQTEVAVLTVTWTVDTSPTQALVDIVEIVGGWMFTEAELRAFQGADITAAAYTDAQIDEVRDAITEEFEQICGVGFIPRFRRQVLPGTGSNELDVTRAKVQSVLACTISGTTVATSNFVPDELIPVVYRTNGVFSRPTASNPANVTISYRYGHPTVPPAIKRAALILAHSRLVADVKGQGVPANASSWTDPSGTYQSFGPSAKSQRWYGMAAVDIALARHNLNPDVF